MVQVPAAYSEAADPETQQMVGVVEVKLTGSPELAVAVSVKDPLIVWGEIGKKLMVCWISPTPWPLS